MKILGIETSCDETAVAIVDGNKQILSHIVLSQLKEHAPYGGVVPEIAARAHMEALDSLITEAMEQAGLTDYHELNAIAVTAGPGLIGGVIVGVMVAKGIASVTGLPIIAVNHLEGHALTARMTEEVAFPFLLLLVSGGHCQILSVSGIGDYTRYGATLDDALGEAYDKVAKMLGLGYPGGPIVEQKALNGDPHRFEFPMPLKGREGCDFSFSGLKTAVKRQVDALGELSEQDSSDICASFQYCVGDILKDRMTHAFELFKRTHSNANNFVVAGGVAANQYLRTILTDLANEHGLNFKAPPLHLCTDNGVMIAWAGLERLQKGLTDSLDFTPKARWPLEGVT